MELENAIKQALDEMADYQDSITALELEKQNQIDMILTPEIKQQIADIEDEFAQKSSSAKEKIAELEEQIKIATVNNGGSVKGKYFHAVFNKPRITLDTKALDDYAIYHPEVTLYRKTGKPYISIIRI